jgi:hypothetical protein
MRDIEVQRLILLHGYDMRYEKYFEINDIPILKEIDKKQVEYNVDLLIEQRFIRMVDESGNLLEMSAKGLKLVEDRVKFDKLFQGIDMNDKQETVSSEKIARSIEYDVFIAHASEDKDEIATPLALKLKKKGLRVWYDDFTLRVGDGLRRSIDKGLASSEYGIVILSPSFFKKEWPQRELDGLAAREIEGKKVILPIWHKLSRAEVVNHSPTLADRIAAKTLDGLPCVVDVQWANLILK